MAELLSSKIDVQEEGPRLQTLPGSATAVIGIIGIAERGPIGQPVRLTSWEDYLNTFGGHTTDGELPNAVRGIYKQDRGAFVECVRTVHHTDITNSATKTSSPADIDIDSVNVVASAAAVTGSAVGPWNLNPGQTLIIHCDEDVGGPDTITFNAVQATRAGSGLSITDINTETLILAFDGGEQQTVTFTATHVGDPDGAAAEINEQIVGGRAVVNAGEIDLTSDTYGTDSSVQVVGGTALTELGHSAGTTTEATSDVANINYVTAAEAKTLIEAGVTNPVTGVTVTEESNGKLTITSDTTGASSSVQVEGSSTATAFGFDNDLHSGSDSSSSPTLNAAGKYDGTYATNYRVVIADATNGETDWFNLVITDDEGVIIENFPNCNMTVDDDDNVVTRVNDENNGSKLFEMSQLLTLRPANGTYTPTGGDDGLTDLDDNDFVGDSAGKTGLHAFDETQELHILSDGGWRTANFHTEMITYCESDREGDCFPVMSLPDNYNANQAVNYVDSNGFVGLTEHGAMYWPNIKIVNPDKTVYGTDDYIYVPVGPWVCGVISRNDRSGEGGIYQQPAGLRADPDGIQRGRVLGAVGFDSDEVTNPRKRDLVYPKRINPVSKDPGTKIYIDGVWNLKGGGNFPSVAERRGVSYIERTIKAGLQEARHANHDEDLRGWAHRTVFAFLKGQMNLGAFRSKDPSTAFFVDFSEALNPPSVVFSNKLIGRIGLATQKPAEWIILYFSQDTRALEAELEV